MSSAPPWPTAPSRAEPHARWHELCRPFGATGHRIEAHWHLVADAYTGPARHYHTLEHIGEVLVWVDQLTRSKRKPAVEFAAWLHDIVYDTARRDNEAESARWAERHLPRLGLDRSVVEAVAQLVLTTIDHRPDRTNRYAAVLADADLAILGAPPTRYGRYVTAVRREYDSLDDERWTEGRRRVLTAFLARPRLYFDESLTALERQARDNLSSELAQLR